MSPSKFLLSTLVAAAAISATSAFADNEPAVETYTKSYSRGDHAYGNEGGNDVWSFTALNFSSFLGNSGDSTVVLSSDGTSNGDAIDVLTNNIYFSGSGEATSSVTITGANISSSDAVRNIYGNIATYYAFIVEGSTVSFSGSGVDISELGLNLNVGTMADATLKIVDGAKVTTTAFYNVVGANGATGEIIVSGSGSELHTQQITLGVATTFSATGDGIGDTYYDTRYLVDDDSYLSDIKNGSNNSYGKITIENGGVMYVGTDEVSAGSSQTKLQLSNGEIDVNGGSLYLGKSSVFTMGGQNAIPDEEGGFLSIAYEQTLTVEGGGLVTNEVQDGTATRLYRLEIGSDNYASDTTTNIHVDGAGSSFDITVGNGGAYIGYSPGGYGSTSWTPLAGGTSTVSILATNSGEFAVTSSSGIYVGQDDGTVYTDGSSGQSCGLSTGLTAEDGGKIELNAIDGSSAYVGRGEPSTGVNSVSVISAGSESSLTISGYSVFVNKGDEDGTFVSFTVSDGATMTLAAQGSGVALYSNTAIEVSGEGSQFNTAGLVVIGGADDKTAVNITIADGGIWNAGKLSNDSASSEFDVDIYEYTSVAISSGGRIVANDGDNNGTINIEDGASVSIEIAAAAGGNEAAISAGSVVISTDAEVSVAIDVSALLSEDLEKGDTFTVSLIEYTQGSLTGTISDDAVSIYNDNQSNWDVSFATTSTMLSVVLEYIPEPSMFGVVAGLGAIGLVAARRRRRCRCKA